MGYYKRLSTYRAEVKRYNASRRKATQLTNTPASGLIRLETVSETERFSMAQDADRLTAYNKAVDMLSGLVNITYTPNYIEGISSVEYASLYHNIILSKNFRNYVKSVCF